MAINEELETTRRGDVLALLRGERRARISCFSGLINVTRPGLDALGLHYSEVHIDPQKMAAAAATSYELFGFESAVVPTNLCVEAAALGAQIDWRTDMAEPAYPLVAEPLFASPADFVLPPDRDWARDEHVSTVVEAIRLLKNRVSNQIVVGAMIPGPFTLAAQVIALANLVIDTRQAPETVTRVLRAMNEMLPQIGNAYRAAGADFLTIHEMGGSPGVIGPPRFEKIVLPPLQELIAALPAPRVLSVCGNTNRAMEMLARAGAEALSVDETNNIQHSRQVLGPGPVLFGNLDPVRVLAYGQLADIDASVATAVESGVDAIWPGCDLWPDVRAENMRALVAATTRCRRSAAK